MSYFANIALQSVNKPFVYLLDDYGLSCGTLLELFAVKVAKGPTRGVVRTYTGQGSHKEMEFGMCFTLE